MFDLRTRSLGFSLPELLLVVVLIGLLASVLSGGFAHLIPFGRQEVALGRARLVNAAKSTYALLEPEAFQRWSEAGDDAAKLQLLLDTRILEGSPNDYLHPTVDHALQMPVSLREPCVILRAGTPLTYSP